MTEKQSNAAMRRGQGQGLARLVLPVASACRAALRWIAAGLSLALQVGLALVLLFEEWGWRPLSEALAWLAQFKLIARVERAIAALPPYAALAVFALPTAVLFPLKLVSLYLVAQGKVVVAGLLFVGAKIASTALIARIFLLTRPALMRMSWFAALYGIVMPWKDAVFAKIRASWAWRYGRMLKSAVRREARRFWQRWRPIFAEATAAVRVRWRALVRRLFGAPGHAPGKDRE